MSARVALPVLGALFAASCIVPIEDVEPDSSGTGGSGGADASSSGGTGAAPDAGGAGGTSSGGSSGSSGGSAGAGTGGSSGSSGASGNGGSSGANFCMLPLADDFSDGLFTPLWGSGAYGGMKVEEINGALKLSFPASPTSVGYGGVFSVKQDYDLTSCNVLARVVETPDPGTDGYVHFAINAGNENVFEFNIGGGTIDAQLWVASSGSDVTTEPFDGTKHVWIKLGESSGQLIWETSADGKIWVPFASAAAPFSVKSVHVVLGAGMYQVESSSPGGGAFDDVNLPP